MQYTCTTCNIQSFEDQEPTNLHVHSSHEYIALVTTVHTCGFLCINLVVVQKLLVFKELAGYITLYSEVDYFLSGFKEASGL